MVKLRTNKEIELLDKRQNSLGSFIIRLIVNSIHADASGVKAEGFYYYQNGEGNDMVLDNFKTQFSWEMVGQAETQLPPFQNSQNLKDAFVQRIVEFSFIQQQIESGQNYGTIYSDWEIDVE